jgi:hypothetical protein
MNRKDEKGSGNDLIEVISCHLSGRDLQTPREPSVRRVCLSRRRFQLVMAGIRVWNVAGIQT